MSVPEGPSTRMSVLASLQIHFKLHGFYCRCTCIYIYKKKTRASARREGVAHNAVAILGHYKMTGR